MMQEWKVVDRNDAGDIYIGPDHYEALVVAGGPWRSQQAAEDTARRVVAAVNHADKLADKLRKAHHGHIEFVGPRLRQEALEQTGRCNIACAVCQALADYEAAQEAKNDDA